MESAWSFDSRGLEQGRGAAAMVTSLARKRDGILRSSHAARVRTRARARWGCFGHLARGATGGAIGRPGPSGSGLPLRSAGAADDARHPVGRPRERGRGSTRCARPAGVPGAADPRRAGESRSRRHLPARRDRSPPRLRRHRPSRPASRLARTGFRRRVLRATRTHAHERSRPAADGGTPSDAARHVASASHPGTREAHTMNRHSHSASLRSRRTP